MKIKVLGCDGGRGINYNTTCLLFNEKALIDAGTIQSKIDIEEALKISHIFFTHTHLDHIVDFPFLLDATFEKRIKPLQVHGFKKALDPMMEHIFNDKIWPNFSKLPTPDSGQFELNNIEPGQTIEVPGTDLRFTPFSANHTVPTAGYKVEDNHSAIVFSGDTGPCDELWDIANNTDNLRAVIVDMSFPIGEQHIADISKHMTANTLEKELKKLKKDCQVYVFHFKVGLSSLLEGQLRNLSHMGKPVLALRGFDEIEF